MDAKQYLEKAFRLSDKYHGQLMDWYKDEVDLSIVPESVVEGYLGMMGSLYITFSYEMEQLDKWYAQAFDLTKFQELDKMERLNEENPSLIKTDYRNKPLSDKATDQKLLLTNNGIRRNTLDRRLKSLKFAKEAIGRSLEARRQGKDYARRN